MFCEVSAFDLFTYKTHLWHCRRFQTQNYFDQEIT